MRNFKIVLAGLVGVSVVGVAACGSGSNGAPPDAEAHGGAERLASVPAGGTATIQAEKSTFSVKVQSVTCGSAAAAAIRDKVAYAQRVNGGPGLNDSQLKNPPAGQQWCVIVLDAKNTGNKYDSWRLTDPYWRNTIDVGTTAYQADDATLDAGNDFQQWAADHGQLGSGIGIDPGASGSDYSVVTIPAGAKPTSIWLDQTRAVGSDAGIELAL
jgi:hypothetical protein